MKNFFSKHFIQNVVAPPRSKSLSRETLNPVNGERFMGLIFKQIVLPNRDRIILLRYWDSSDPVLSLDDENHNIFRLNPKGEIVWQVKRDDAGKFINWENMHLHARERGEDGARERFMEFILKYPDGTDNINPQNGCPPDEAVWTPSCTIWLRGSAYQQYILDPETGIARNVTEGRPRPW